MTGPDLPTLFQAGNVVSGAFTVEVPPGFRAPRASARLYVSDRGSVLGPPLNIRIQVIHPTPEEIVRTPVVIPQNHIRMFRDRFDVREFTVVSETSLTWTNRDTRQHSVKVRRPDPQVAVRYFMEDGLGIAAASFHFCWLRGISRAKRNLEFPGSTHDSRLAFAWP